MGYVNRRKVQKSAKNEGNNTEVKKEFLIKLRGQSKYVKEYELEMARGVMGKLTEIRDPPPQQLSSNRTPQKQRSYFDQEDQSSRFGGGGSLKYLSKFIQ